MRDEDIKKAFGELTPTEEQRERIFRQLRNTQKPGLRKRRVQRRTVAVAASVVLAVFLTGIGVNAATGGKMIEYIGGLFTSQEVKEDIVSQIGVTRLKGFEIWAPNIYDVTENRIIFGDRRGLIIYDRQNETISTTLDLQAIDCAYFDGDNKDTCILVKDNSLVIYNTENGVPFGNYYIFDLKTENNGLLEEYQDGEDSTSLKKYAKEWSSIRKNHFDNAFLEFEESEPVYNSDRGLGMYSKELYRWDGGDSIIYIDNNNKFYLYTKAPDTGAYTKEEIIIGDLVNSNPITSQLPKAGYIGNDPVEKAVYEALLKEGEKYYAPDRVDYICIPVLNTVGQQVLNDEILYYGNFYIESYIRNGNILESVSGGSIPGVMHLRKLGEEYTVAEFEKALDGGEFESSIEAMCRGNQFIYEKFMSGISNDKARDEAKLLAIREYVNNSGLQDEIKYYKEYGWDPVAIN